MPDVKVSTRQELAFTDLDPEADLMLVTDTSAVASRSMKAAELMRAAAPYLSTAWDFATGSLGPTVSFTRASSGYRFNSAGLLVSEATDAPRFDFDPILLTPSGLLIEDAATNNFQRSAEFNNVYWNKTNTTVTADAAVAPDGTTTMDKLVENSASGTHVTYRGMSVVSGTTYAFEVFVKADTRTWCSLAFQSTGFGSTLRSYFNVGAGTLGTIAAGVAAFIQHVGGGIYRCVAIATATATASANISLDLASADLTVVYTGDGASGLYFWGANFKAVDCATSYIQTTTASATRAADVALITNRRVLTDQCWVVKGRTPRRIANGAVNIAFEVDDGTNGNLRCLQYRTDGTLAFIATVGGVTQCLVSLGAVAANTDFAVSVRWANNNFAASLNGGAVVTDVSGANPEGLTVARVGCGASGNYWNSTIRHIETRRFATDAELVLLSQ